MAISVRLHFGSPKLIGGSRVDAVISIAVINRSRLHAILKRNY
jgi:hypothetical protein